MANNFISTGAKAIGTTPVVILTGVSASQNTVIGLSLANISTSPVTATVYIGRSAVPYYLVYQATVPVGSSLIVIGNEQKVVLLANDALTVVSSAALSLDAWVSYLSIT